MQETVECIAERQFAEVAGDLILWQDAAVVGECDGMRCLDGGENRGQGLLVDLERDGRVEQSSLAQRREGRQDEQHTCQQVQETPFMHAGLLRQRHHRAGLRGMDTIDGLQHREHLAQWLLLEFSI